MVDTCSCMWEAEYDWRGQLIQGRVLDRTCPIHGDKSPDKPPVEVSVGESELSVENMTKEVT